MSQTKEETIEQLKEFSEALKTKEYIELFQQKYPTFQSYVDATIQKPQKKTYVPVEPPADYMKRAETAIYSRRYTFKTLLVVSCVLFALGILFMIVAKWLFFLTVLCFVFGGCTLAGGFVVRGRIPAWQKRAYDMRMEIEAQNRQIKSEVDYYNNGEYLRLMAEYEEALKEASENYRRVTRMSEEEKREIDRKIESGMGLISEKFYPVIDEIVTLMEDGRADTIKEALNIYCMANGI